MDNESSDETKPGQSLSGNGGARVTAASHEAAKNRKFKDLGTTRGTRGVPNLTGL